MDLRPPAERLLAGPSPAAGAETHVSHVARLGGLPSGAGGGDLIRTLEASGLLGRGGAGFPVGRKWRSIAERRDGPAILLVNGAEGEPRSAKDRALMTFRPHLVLDGSVLAADAIGAEEIVVYVGGEHHQARAVMSRAIAERADRIGRTIRLVAAPIGYVAGEASAAVNFVNSGAARPTTAPPRPSERGVRGRPTLVQNVESLAYAALIARFGDPWYRSVGRFASRGTALVTVSGGAGFNGVLEIELGVTVGELAATTGAEKSDAAAVLVGGYFGTWADAAAAWDLALDPVAMRERDLAFGCGMVSFLPAGRCGVDATATVIGFMADASAGQCGPCLHGLRAISDATKRLAAGEAGTGDLGDVERWTGQIAGRGACRHPDGAVGFMASALEVFGEEFSHHARTRRCSFTRSRVVAA